MFSTKTLTKQEILSKIKEEDIFERYLGIKPEFNKGFTNPLRIDRHPDCRFYISKDNIIKFRDIAKNWHWDCFNIVEIKFKCNFYDALKIIAEDFNLKELSPDTELLRKNEIRKLNINSNKLEIKFKLRKYLNFDVDFWKQFNISLKILNYYNVYPISLAYMNKQCVYRYSNSKSLCYVYYDGENKSKLYFPLRDKSSPYPKFYSSFPSLEGYNQLPRTGKILFITKSRKDVMSMFSFNLNAIAVPSETVLLSQLVMDHLYERFDIIFTLFDRDRTGMSLSYKMRKKYNTIPLLFDKTEEKDFAANVKRYGNQYMLDYIEQFNNEYT